MARPPEPTPQECGCPSNNSVTWVVDAALPPEEKAEGPGWFCMPSGIRCKAGDVGGGGVGTPEQRAVQQRIADLNGIDEICALPTSRIRWENIPNNVINRLWRTLFRGTGQMSACTFQTLAQSKSGWIDRGPGEPTSPGRSTPNPCSLPAVANDLLQIASNTIIAIAGGGVASGFLNSAPGLVSQLPGVDIATVNQIKSLIQAGAEKEAIVKTVEAMKAAGIVTAGGDACDVLARCSGLTRQTCLDALSDVSGGLFGGGNGNGDGGSSPSDGGEGGVPNLLKGDICKKLRQADQVTIADAFSAALSAAGFGQTIEVQGQTIDVQSIIGEIERGNIVLRCASDRCPSDLRSLAVLSIEASIVSAKIRVCGNQAALRNLGIDVGIGGSGTGQAALIAAAVGTGVFLLTRD